MAQQTSPSRRHFELAVERIDRTLETTFDVPTNARKTLPKSLLLRVASDTHHIQSSDWP